MKYIVSGGIYNYDIESILGVFGFEKSRVVNDADFELFISDGRLFLRGGSLDFSTSCLCSKNELKRRVFRYLAEKFGTPTGWGILVGVRPVKLASQLLAGGLNADMAVDFLVSEYLLDEKNARLIVEIGKYENDAATSEENSVSLYVSVPFCPTRCKYCSFPMQPLATKHRLLEPYFEHLCIELEETLKMLKQLGKIVDCVYFGGGTPSTLSTEMIDTICGILRKYADADRIREFTFEAGRSDTTSPELFECLRRNGVGRVSINPQSFTPSALDFAMRRRHEGEFEAAFAQARAAGLLINSDIILGLDMESEDEYVRGLEYLISLAPENITIHALALKRGSELFGSLESAGDNVCGGRDFNEARRMYVRMSERGNAVLRRAGYAPYYLYRQKRILANLENVGYCKAGAGCLYNSRIMSERSTIVAVGTGGVSKICFPAENRHEQIANARSVEEYISNFDKVTSKIETLRGLMHKQ